MILTQKQELAVFGNSNGLDGLYVLGNNIDATGYTHSITVAVPGVMNDATAATGVFMSEDGKRITVVDGIVRKIEG